VNVPPFRCREADSGKDRKRAFFTANSFLVAHLTYESVGMGNLMRFPPKLGQGSASKTAIQTSELDEAEAFAGQTRVCHRARGRAGAGVADDVAPTPAQFPRYSSQFGRFQVRPRDSVPAWANEGDLEGFVAPSFTEAGV